MASAAAAQERVFVAQSNPAQVHSFEFTGAAFVEDDLDPDSARLGLQGGLDPAGLAITPRQFLIASGFQSLGMNTLDRATGLELPRTRTTVALPSGIILTSAAGDFAFIGGLDTNRTPVLSIVDLRPAAATFLSEVASVSFGGTTVPGKGMTAMELDASQQLLYVAIRRPGTPTTPPKSEIRIVDVSTPAAPSLKPAVVSFAPSPPINALRRFSSLGGEFLVAGGAFRIFKVAADGTLTLSQQITFGAPSNFKIFRDFRFAATPAGDRLFAITHTFNPPGSGITIDEVLELDMRRATATAAFPATLLHSYQITASGDNGFDSLSLSDTGAYLYVLDEDARSGAPLLALDRDKLMAGLPPFLANAIIPGVNLSAGTTGLVVSSAFSPSAGGPQITSVDVDGVAGAVLVNDQPRTLTIHGSGLGGVAHVSSV
jgi:hypothetical protein